MNAWQLDLMAETERSQAWERLNAPDPCAKQLKNAAVSIKQALQTISHAENQLADAMTEVFDTPMEMKIGSYLDSLQDIRIDLKELAEKYERGERE